MFRYAPDSGAKAEHRVIFPRTPVALVLTSEPHGIRPTSAVVATCVPLVGFLFPLCSRCGNAMINLYL